jgi:hypothetical protein
MVYGEALYYKNLSSLIEICYSDNYPEHLFILTVSLGQQKLFQEKDFIFNQGHEA